MNEYPDSMKINVEVVVMKSGERVAEEKFKAISQDEARIKAYAIASKHEVDVSPNRVNELWMGERAIIKIWDKI